MAAPPAAIDPDVLRRKQNLIGSYTTGLFQSGIIYAGRELGLWKAMRGGEPTTPGELGERVSANERFVLEWLRAAAAGGLVEYDGDERFHLAPEVESLLADDESLLSAQWFFVHLPDRVGQWARALESFRSGVGIGWEDRGLKSVEMTEAAFRTWYRQVLVQRALPQLDGVLDRLDAGRKVADVGCGAGVALIEMARAFPRSEFHGYDLSAEALERGRAHAAEERLTNLTFHRVPDELLPEDRSFGLITTFDCMHDMTQPLATARAIRASLADDGCWFIADIRSFPTFEENLADNPQSARMYAVSLFGCLQSAMSEPGGAGYGTYGLPEPAMRQLALDAGFTRFRTVDLPSPVNAYYEARP
jgi:2-polyprenyl-3-methyl-5-hydroxy-6-metoxy-1,4-benzoquinol methylase